MVKMISITDELGIELDKIRNRYKNPVNNKPASYSYAIGITLKKNRRLRRKVKELEKQDEE
jgi:hypothetical protein